MSARVLVVSLSREREREKKNQVAVEMTSTTSRRSIAQKDDFYKGDLRDVKKKRENVVVVVVVVFLFSLSRVAKPKTRGGARANATNERRETRTTNRRRRAFPSFWSIQVCVVHKGKECV